MMNHESRASLPAVLAVAAASFLVAGIIAAAPPDNRGATPPGLIKNSSRAANVDLPSHAKAGTGVAGDLDAAALDARKLNLTLADGRTIEARLQRVVKDENAGQQSWVGVAVDMPGSMLVMTKYRGVTTGFLTYGSETWELMPAKNGKHVFYQVDDDKLPTEEPVLFPDDVDLDTGGTSDYGTGGATDADADYVHDLLVVYTPAARSAVGQATLESQIQNAVAAANQAYLNSGVNITLNLVGMQEIAYSEPGDSSTTLSHLRGTNDGQMDGVHSLRDRLGADLVSLVTNSLSSCGIAYSMRSESSAYASSAFNVVKRRCFSNHSLAHEVGHNQGNMHNRESTSNTGAFAYSYGFRRCTSDGTGFRTVMSYSCSGANRVTQFSNPNVNFNGYPTGIAYESDPGGSAENVRSMNNTADTVAAYRGASGGGSEPTTEPTAPNAPSSISATADSSTRVTVRWRDNSDNETGFRLERSANGVDFSEIATLGAGTTSYRDSGLSSRTTYYYRVRAYNSVGNSGFSNTDSVTTPDEEAPPPAAPSSVAATNNGDGSATVSWTDASSNETGFEIQRETWDTRKSTWSQTKTVGSVPAGVTSMADQSGPGTYRYRVRAVNGSAASAYAGPASTTVTGGDSTNNGPGNGRGGGSDGGGKPGNGHGRNK
ncbi:MAG: M12 family metallo-peptidase [Gammaproteobacteria bacterium]